MEDEAITEVERQNRVLSQKLEGLAKKLNCHADRKQENSLSDFWSHCKQKQVELSTRAHKMGISIVETLGFPQAIPSAAFHEGYWYALSLGYQVTTLFLKLSSEEELLPTISQISYPGLQTALTSSRNFITEFPIEVTMEGRLTFIKKFVRVCSELEGVKDSDASQYLFLKLTQAVIEPLPERSAGMVRAKFTLTALRILPEGEVATGNVSTTPSPQEQKVTPIWERY
jgi:hypothetical protein